MKAKIARKIIVLGQGVQTRFRFFSPKNNTLQKVIPQAIYTFQLFGPETQFGDISLVRRIDSATRRLALARRFASSIAWIGGLDRVIVLIRRLAVLISVHRLHSLLLHFGAPTWFADPIWRFAVYI